MTVSVSVPVVLPQEASEYITAFGSTATLFLEYGTATTPENGTASTVLTSGTEHYDFWVQGDLDYYFRWRIGNSAATTATAYSPVFQMPLAYATRQEFLRGLGNIYADEALFRSGIHPKTNSARLGPTRAGRLHTAVQEVLKDAIAQGGSTVANYVNSEGTQGYFQLRTCVYGKTGEPCKKCGSRIRRTIVASRSTHFCPKCQRR